MTKLMKKTILITGATDGIGLETAKQLIEQGHHVLLHGRNPSKLAAVESQLSSRPGREKTITYRADLSILVEVKTLVQEISGNNNSLDVLINNAGVYNAAQPITSDGLDIRFMVNAIAPYVLTQHLLPLLSSSSRVINVSSAAQATVNPQALTGQIHLSDGTAYAQSKLALTMWSRQLALSLGSQGPAIIAVNPGSLLGSKMVKQAFGIAGSDLNIGASILRRAALSDEFATASGQYFDNDSGQFAPPHADAQDLQKCEQVVSLIKAAIEQIES